MPTTANKNEPECLNCGGETWRESVDVGVGVIHGPYGCSRCGWSEDDRYDRSNPDFVEPVPGFYADPQGGLHRS